MRDSAPSYERALVVANPTKAGTPRFARAERQIAYLADHLGLTLDRLDTHAEAAETQAELADRLPDYDLLMVVGGDGTLNQAVGSLVEVSPDQQPTLLAVPAGNANDFSRSQHGKLRGIAALHQAVQQSEVRTISPIRIDVAPGPENLQTHLGVNNAGFHYTALAAQLLNSVLHREGRFHDVPLVGRTIQEMLTVERSLRDLKAFQYREKTDAELIGLADRAIVHARCAVKHGRFAVEHTSDYFLDIKTINPTRRAILAAAGRLALGTSRAEKLRLVQFETGEEMVLGHTDGETFEIAPGSQVSVSLDERSFKALGSR